MIFPIGTRMQWRSDIPPRWGQQRGALSRDWEQYAAFPWIIWDGEQNERQELPECVRLVGQVAAPAGLRDAWAEKARAR